MHGTTKKEKIMFKVTIDGKEVEVKPEDITPGAEGFNIVTPDKVPSGLFTEEAVQKRIQDRVKNTAENARKEAEQDEAFRKNILSQYGVQLGEDGKPKGLKPEVDIEEVKSNVTKEVSQKYEGQLNDYKEKLSKRDQAVIESSILSATSGLYREDWLKAYGDGKPLVVRQFADRFTVDDQGRAVLKDADGGLKYKGDGSPITPKDYLTDETQFGDLMRDKRQRGSNFGGGGDGSPAPSGSPAKWTLKQKNEFIDKNGKDAYKELLQKQPVT